MGATSQAPLPPFVCRGAMQTPRVGCPSLHPFPLPHAPHWGHAQPKGGTRSGGAKGKRCPSPIACEHDPACRPACTTPACPTFGCQACAVPHVGWHVHGGIRRWGVQGSCTWDDAWGCAHTLFPAGVESAPHTSTSCAGCATPHLAQLRAQEPRACACPHPLCQTPTSLPAVGVEAARRATLGRVEEAACDSGGGGRGCTSPCTTWEVASTRPRVRMHEPVRNPGSGQPPTLAAEGEAKRDNTQPQQIGEGRRSEAAQPWWAGRVRETMRDPKGEAPPPLGAQATPHLCLHPRLPPPPHPASDLEKKTVHSLCKLYYIILSIYLFLGLHNYMLWC